MAALNHPRKGASIRVEAIREMRNVKNIKRLLANKPRDLCLFTLGINTNLRASDLLKITVGQVRYLNVADCLDLKEKKTQKERKISINKTVYDSIQNLLAVMPDAADHEPLFQSRKGSKCAICVSSLNRLVKSWCKEINLTGNYGSHTLRKTFGYMHRTVKGTDIPTLMTLFNHSTQRQCLAYVGINSEEIKNAYMFEI